MQYNLTKDSFIETNLNVGNVYLHANKLLPIIQSTSAGYPTLSGSNMLCLDCDLGYRIKIGEIRYYFNSITDSGVVSSGINFYCKNESFESYDLLNTYIDNSYYYSTLSSGVVSTRYIRLLHTVSGTGISGTVNGFEITNNDSIVDFGATGNETSDNFEISLINQNIVIKEVEIYNNGDAVADAYIILEPQYDESDNVLSIANNLNGPWQSTTQSGNMITGVGMWNTGTSNNLYQTSLWVESYPVTTTGTYTTRIFDTIDRNKFTRLNVTTTYTDNYSVAVTSGVLYDFNTGTDAGWYKESGNTCIFSNNRLENNLAGSTVYNTISTFYSNFGWKIRFKICPRGGGYNNTSLYILYQNSSNYDIYIYISSLSPEFRLANTQGILYSGTKYTYSSTTNIYMVECIRVGNIIAIKHWLATDTFEPSVWDWYGYVDQSLNIGKITFISYDQGAFSSYVDDINFIVYENDIINSRSLIAVDTADTQETIEIKSSNTEPLSYMTYIKYSSSAINEYWLNTDGLKRLLYSVSISSYEIRFYYDIRTNKLYSMFVYPTGQYGGYPTLVIRKSSNYSSYEYENVLTMNTSGLYIYSLLGCKDEGCWCYIYVNVSYSDVAYEITSDGYYLMHFTSNLTNNYKLYNDSGFIYDMSVVYSTGDLWYSNIENNYAIKIDVSGNVLVSTSLLKNIRGIVVTEDGGCWVIQDTNIFQLNTNGVFINQIDLSDIAIGLSRIALDNNEALWIADDTYIRRVFLDGRVDFSVDLEMTISEIQATNVGVAAMCVDRRWRFIGKFEKKLLKIFDVGEVYTSYAYFIGEEYNNLYLSSQFPVIYDTYWNGLPWEKISLNNYLLPQEKYHQIRLTLNACRLNSLYLNEGIELSTIYPKNYKPVYVKASLNDQDENDVGTYDSVLRVWWYVEG